MNSEILVSDFSCLQCCSCIDKPVIDRKGSSLKRIPAQKDDIVEMKCSAISNPPASFEWRKLGVKVGSNSTIFVKMKKSTDFGSYVCTVSNAIGFISYTVTVFEVGE
jgi:hypothetical protein